MWASAGGYRQLAARPAGAAPSHKDVDVAAVGAAGGFRLLRRDEGTAEAVALIGTRLLVAGSDAFGNDCSQK